MPTVASLRHWFETMTIAPVSRNGFPKAAVCNLKVFSLYMSKRYGPRSELDSHANMIVVGDNVLMLADSGVTCPVQGYNPESGPNEHKIVDVAVKHDCPVTAKSYIIIMYDALQVSGSEVNLLPPFLLREAGWKVNDVPRVHCEDPGNDDHCLILPGVAKIYMTLRSTFSGFESYAPTIKEVEDAYEKGEILVMSPERWDPSSDVFEDNEDSLTNYDGSVIGSRKRKTSFLTASSVMEQGKRDCMNDCYICESDDAARSLVSISAVYDISSMCERLQGREEALAISTSLCTTSVVTEDVLFDVGTLQGQPRSSAISPAELSRVFGIDRQTAKATLRVTSQRIRRADNPSLSRNYSTNDRMLRYRRLRRDFYMDTFFAGADSSEGWDGRSTRGFKSVQLFVSDTGYLFGVLMKTLEEIPEAISQFLRDVGAPDVLVADAHSSHQSMTVKRLLSRAGTRLRLLEEGTPWSNKGELYVGLLKGSVVKDMKRSNSPKVFWDYCTVRRIKIHNKIASKITRLEGQTPHFDTFGEEPDISREAQFEWYEFCYFYDKSSKFPSPREVLGRVLGPAENAGNEMAMWILKSNGEVVARQSLRRLTEAEINSSIEKEKCAQFDRQIQERYGPGVVKVSSDESKMTDLDEIDDFTPYEDDVEAPSFVPDYEEVVDESGRVVEVCSYDRFLSAELEAHFDGQTVNGKVSRRITDQEGKPIGEYDPNPLKNTAIYEVEFENGMIREYAANAIAEAIYSQCDAEGWRYTLLDGILDYKVSDQAEANRFVYTKCGRRRLRKTTKGWSLKIRWKNGDEAWVPLAVMKESHPVETAEFAEAHRLSNEPAFAWWVPYTLKKKKVIINALKFRKKKKTHKYGIRVPQSVSEAYEIDREDGTDLWSKAIDKEMGNNSVAFSILEDDEPLPVGYSLQSGHMVFDVKMDLTRKARWVLDGHKAEDVDGSTYAGVVSRESVRIALTYAALHDLDVWAADIQNAYLQAPSSQKHYIICGPEFGLENQGKRALIKRALYGGKTAGKDFRDHLRDCMKHLGFETCLADPDVWMRPTVLVNGDEVYEYVLLYTDDCLVISDKAESILRNEIGKYFTLKDESIGHPEIYLGGQMRQVKLVTGQRAWAFGSSKYVKAATSNVIEQLKKLGKSLPKRAKTPLSSNYRPELDVSSTLNAKDAAQYQSLIGVLRWIVELGRIDICCEVSMMSSHLAMPREGHLDQVYHIFAYLHDHHNAELVFDPTYPSVDKSKFERQDWSSTPYEYKELEELPLNMPTPRGKWITIRVFVDADHAGDSTTRKSRTGFIVFVNNAPVYWLSKKQTGVETSSFGSEFTAMKQCCEYVRGLRYRLRMMGIQISECAFIYGDNQSVLYNTTLPDSTLKKKSQSIAYHFVREGVARDEWRTTYINTNDNPADLLTKPLSAEKRATFVNMVLHHVFSYAYVEEENDQDLG